jgi:sugar/nucleoside kinase (ribokinase family)
LLALGCKTVLIKGGHGQGAESIDYLIDSSGVTTLAAPRVATKNTHGTGCSLSSAIAAGLAKGEGMETPFATPRLGSALRLPPQTASASGMATARSIIFRSFIEALRPSCLGRSTQGPIRRGP